LRRCSSELHKVPNNVNINRIGVIGAGLMGSGIAQVSIQAGIDVVLLDVADAALEKGRAGIRKNLDRAVDKGKLEDQARDKAMKHLTTTVDYAALSGVDMVIEAATENPDIKFKILRRVESAMGPQGVIATNTSSISITQLAAVLSEPSCLIGLHFFNPVPVMALVELIRGLQTSDDTHSAATTFAQRIGKTPITVKNSPGFAVNRILVPMINEAVFVLQEGLATADDIDAGMKLGCNHPIGPLALADLIGLDTLLAVLNVFYEGFNDPKYRPAPLLRELVAAGRLGRKSGRGFHVY
jgi:3-hydroxybutyryl-CoA dehydrogenase